MAARCLEQASRAFDVGAHKWGRIQNRPVHLGFGCEIDNGVKRILGKHAVDIAYGCNIASHKAISRISSHVFEVSKIPGVSQQIEIQHADVFASFENVANKAGANKTRAARNEN